MSADEENSKGLHQSHPVDPNMMQPRAPKKSVWHARSKIALDKAKKRILVGITGDHNEAWNEDSDDSADEASTFKRKSHLILPTTTAHSQLHLESCDMKPGTFHLISSQSSHTAPSPISPAPSDTDPFDSEDSRSSDDSLF